MILLLEHSIRGGKSSILRDHYVKSDKIERYYILLLIKCMDGNVSNAPYDGMKTWQGHRDWHLENLEVIVKTLDNIDTWFFVEFHLKYPNITKQKAKTFPIFPDNKNSPQSKIVKEQEWNKTRFFFAK